MNLTFDELLTDLKHRCSLENESGWDSELTDWLNLGLAAVERKTTWPFLWAEATITTIADIADYAIGNTVLALDFLRDITNSAPLNSVPYTKFPNATSTGRPYMYYLSGTTQTDTSQPPYTQITVYPIPAGVYTLKAAYYQRLGAIAGSQIIPIPNEFIELPILYAQALYFAKMGDKRTNFTMQLFENTLLAIVERYDPPQLRIPQFESFETRELRMVKLKIPRVGAIPVPVRVISDNWDSLSAHWDDNGVNWG